MDTTPHLPKVVFLSAALLVVACRPPRAGIAVNAIPQGPIEAHGCGEAGTPPPELGPPPTLRGNDRHVVLRCGLYRGDLQIRGHNVIVEGAGAGRTIIEGAVVVSGHDIAVRGVTALEPSNVRGHAIDLRNSEFAGGVEVRGHDIAQ
jgi:hypothetical protein